MYEINPLYDDFYDATPTEVPQLDEDGNVVYMEDVEMITGCGGNQTSITVPITQYVPATLYTVKRRPQRVDAAYIRDRVNPNVYNKFAELAIQTIQWDWFIDHQKWFNDGPIAPLEPELEEYPESEVNPWDSYQVSLDEWNNSEPPRPTQPTPEQYLINTGLLTVAWTESRDSQIAELVVEVDGMLFDADERSQDRMARAVAVGEAGVTTKWKLADNTIVEVTWGQLKEALIKGGEATTEIWMSSIEV